MSQVRQPAFKIVYNKKDITAEITPYVASIRYKDATEGKSDEIQIEVSNTTGIWLNEWYPTLGDTMTVSIGWPDLLMKCGTFEVDEPEVKFGPDIMVIKGIAAGISKSTRTKRSDQHENKTLAQIAKKVADRYGYTISGTIADTGQIVRETQNMETDLSFLKRLSMQYGHLFSVRDSVITFTNMYELEALAAAATISRNDIKPGSTIKDKSYDTYKKVHLKSFNPMAKKVYETTFAYPDHTNVDGFTYQSIVKDDVKEVRTRVGSNQEANLKAVAELHSSNSKQQEGVITVVGNPLLVAGNNFELTEVGKISGTYHIAESDHLIIPGEGYETEIHIKRVGYINIEKTKRKKPKKVKTVKINRTK